MDIHQNARTTPYGRRLMIRRLSEGWPLAAVAEAAGVAPKTVRKWRDRHAAEGQSGLLDRSSRPHRSPNRLDETVEAEIVALRHGRLSGPAIARRLGRPVSTVGQVLRRHGLGRLGDLEPRPAAIRYERDQPGELIHVDIKKLGRINGVGHRASGGARSDLRRRRRQQAPEAITGDRTTKSRGAGWDFLHVCVDDGSRLAFTRVLPDEHQESAVLFLGQALAWFTSLGVKVERVMTDNGSAYVSHAFRRACEQAGLKHKRTRPYTPRTNGLSALPTSLRGIGPWPSASSRPACASGPMPNRSTARQNAPPPCRPGSAPTTAEDPTPPSKANHPSQG